MPIIKVYIYAYIDSCGFKENTSTDKTWDDPVMPF